MLTKDARDCVVYGTVARDEGGEPRGNLVLPYPPVGSHLALPQSLFHSTIVFERYNDKGKRHLCVRIDDDPTRPTREPCGVLTPDYLRERYPDHPNKNPDL